MLLFHVSFLGGEEEGGGGGGRGRGRGREGTLALSATQSIAMARPLGRSARAKHRRSNGLARFQEPGWLGKPKQETPLTCCFVWGRGGKPICCFFLFGVCILLFVVGVLG